MRAALVWLCVFCGVFGASVARAEVLEAPIGGRPFPLGEGRVACAPVPVGFTVEGGGHLLRPPSEPEAIGRAVELKVAHNPGQCDASDRFVTLIAVGPLPTFDAASIVFAPDEGSLEAKGRRLAGVMISWKSERGVGNDTCRDPRSEGGVERCSWGVGRDAPADPAHTSFSYLPAGARSGTDVVLYDEHARRVDFDSLVLVPAKVTITRLVPVEASVDLSTGQGEVPLVHPEAVASAECSNLACEMVDGRLLVSGASSLVNNVDLRLRLIPHVYLSRRDTLESQLSVRLPVLHCPMSIASGPPVRSNDEARVVVRLEGRCGRDLSSVRFMVEDRTLKVLRTATLGDAAFVVLRLGNVSDDAVTITAVRGGAEGIALAVAHGATRPAPPVRASLELDGYPNLSFIPTNRDVTVHVSAAGEHQYFAVLPIDAVYSVSYQSGRVARIRADPNAAGLAELRFGLRAESLPPQLSDVDLAVVTDPLQRGIGEANLPAPISAVVNGRGPLIEVLCGGGPEKLAVLQPGVTAHLPFSLRDTCRVVFHRERLAPEYGTQKLNFEIEVFRPDGSTRGEARVNEVVTLRSGDMPREAWIRGVVDPFDRIVVRVSHQADENHYIGASEIKTGAPAAQWSAVLGTGRARLYGTSTIPTGLYRFADRANSGVLSLNFGVISRLTWLDAEGHEGFIGAEAGVLVFGLANSQSQTGKPLTQIGAVLGLGVSVPIANRAAVSQASIALHAWFEANISDSSPSSRYAFIFGPSITIGNVGTNL